MSCSTNPTCRLTSMLCLIFAFFLVEFIYGHITHSLALIGDSYHMLSDLVALIVAIIAVRMSTKQSRKNTYGWVRAEVLGALVNSVFLIALCFTIFVEAIERLTVVHVVEHTDWMLYVGIAGFVVNVIGLALFHQHSGSHGHSHQHGHKERVENNQNEDMSSNQDAVGLESSANQPNDSVTVDGINTESGSSENDDSSSSMEFVRPRLKSSEQLNMRGIFLHVLGDAFGSIIVIVSALVIRYVDGEWKYKVDPVMSLLLVAIMLATTIPLLRESALILMQTVPTHIRVGELKKKLLSSVEGVLDVHEFHVWQLAGNRIIASAHIRCLNLDDYMRIAENIKIFFHNEGIHSTTIQPEFVEVEEAAEPLERDCVLECGPDKQCHVDTCCAVSSGTVSSKSPTAGTPESRKLRKMCSEPTASNPVRLPLKIDKSSGVTGQLSDKGFLVNKASS